MLLLRLLKRSGGLVVPECCRFYTVLIAELINQDEATPQRRYPSHSRSLSLATTFERCASLACKLALKYFTFAWRDSPSSRGRSFWNRKVSIFRAQCECANENFHFLIGQAAAGAVEADHFG